MNEFAQPVFVSDRRATDEEHLRLLSIFHFVGAGLALLMLPMLAFEYRLIRVIFERAEVWRSGPNGLPPEFFDFFQVFVVLFSIYYVVQAALNIVSGIFLRQKKHRIFSIVVAAVNCLHLPLGTALGVFTIVVLSRDSVTELYREAQFS